MILELPSERGMMSDKLKPVRCGCGGEAQYEAYENYNFGSYIAHIMICDKCGMRTAEWPTEAEAIEAWNRAMGERTDDLISRQAAIDALDVPDADGMFTSCGYAMRELRKLPSAGPERTAKAIEHDASVTDTDGYKYHRSEYLCGACKKKVLGGDDYCSHCGAKLEWGE